MSFITLSSDRTDTFYSVYAQNAQSQQKLSSILQETWIVLTNSCRDFGAIPQNSSHDNIEASIIHIRVRPRDLFRSSTTFSIVTDINIAPRAAEVRRERRCGRLCRAAIGGRVHDVEDLLQRGADVDYVRPIISGYTMLDPNDTPLHAAAAHGRKAVVYILTAAGADLNRRTVLEHSGRRTEDSGPTHVASGKGYEDVLKALLLAGADVDLENATGDTALHIAASKGLDNILDLLLHAGGQVNYQNQSGCTALHEAAAASHEHIVKSLIKAGGDPGIRNNRQEMPLESGRRLSCVRH